MKLEHVSSFRFVEVSSTYFLKMIIYMYQINIKCKVIQNSIWRNIFMVSLTFFLQHCLHLWKVKFIFVVT